MLKVEKLITDRSYIKSKSAEMCMAYTWRFFCLKKCSDAIFERLIIILIFRLYYVV